MSERDVTALPLKETLDDLIEWARTTRYFGPDDFERLARLADRTEELRQYVHRLGGWLADDPDELVGERLKGKP